MNPPKPTHEIVIQVLSQGLIWAWVASNDRGVQLREEGLPFAIQNGFYAPGDPVGDIRNSAETHDRYEIRVSPLFNLYEVAAFLGRDGKVSIGDGQVITPKNYQQWEDRR